MSLRICIVGCGNWSSSMHGPSYAKYAATHPDSELADSLGGASGVSA
jgi:predicted dehydrogenase